MAYRRCGEVLEVDNHWQNAVSANSPGWILNGLADSLTTEREAVLNPAQSRKTLNAEHWTPEFLSDFLVVGY
jgi:hypothetical protein